MYKKITALCLVLCLLLSLVPASAGADTATVTADAVTVTAGSAVTLSIKAANFADLAGLELYIYYDEALSVSSTTVGSLLSGAQASVNTATAGQIKLSAMSLDGISGSGTLLSIAFQAAADCAAGTYPVKLAVGEAYDTALAAVSVGSTDGSVTVSAAAETVENFSIYTYVDNSTLCMGDTLTFRIASASRSRAFTGADFTVEYDPEIFAYDSYELESALQTENAIWSVNAATQGQVRISYIGTEPVSAFYLVKVRLTVIADMDGTTTVTGRATNVYREDLTAYGPGSWLNTVTLQKLPEVIDYPDAFLQTGELIVGQQTTSVFTVEGGTGMAAADFTVTYDPAVLQCVAVTKADASHGGMVVINDNFTEGKVRFSYVNLNTCEDEIPLVQITWLPLQSPSAHYELALSGVGVVDAQQNAITLEYVTDTGCIHQGVITAPTCTEDGCTTYTCTACGDVYVTDTVSMLGHDIQIIEAKDPTCTEDGWSEGEGCTRCDYRSQGEVYPALGHALVDHAARAANCTDIGWDAYQTCSRCSYSTYREIASLGHRVIEEQVVLVDPLAVDNSGEVPFVITDGIYYSNNHTSSSSSEFTVTALYDCTLNLIYGVSSEQNYDKLFILLNGAQQAVISGEVSGQVLTLSLTAGDAVTVRYTKDVSLDRFEDRGWASLEYEHVWVSALTDIPADTLAPDCEHAVACAYCDTVVKEALGHSWTEGNCTTDKVCTTCGETEAALGHSYETVVTAPTCTEGGYTTYTCAACGDTYAADQVEATGHSYENFLCTACGEVDTDSLTAMMDLSGDGKVTAFDAQLLAEAMADRRELTDRQWETIGILTPGDIIDYVLGRYPVTE